MTVETARQRPATSVADEGGFILPLVLLGLVAVTIMLTASLLTSSAEVAISGAQQDATASLYTQESALQQFIAANAATPLQPSSAAVHPLSATTNIRVARLSETTPSPGSVVSVFAVTAEPVAGTLTAGRTIVALVRQTTSAPRQLQPQIGGALTLAGNLNARSGAFGINGRSDTCASTGVQAVRKATGSPISGSGAGSDAFTGMVAASPTQGTSAIESTDLNANALVREALGRDYDEWLADLVARLPAAQKYGPRFRAQDGTVRSFSGYMDTAQVTVVDAAGGSVEVRAGSALLVIVNGDLRMGANSRFDGIAIVEGGFRLDGSAVVNGALISLGRAGAAGVLGSEATSGGRATVQYDLCAIQQAKQAYDASLGTGTTFTTGETFAWFEAVR
jgi:Tfp pilus assembly protein PilE